MQIFYCEKCGLRIKQGDLDAGSARVTAENVATCPNCLTQAQAAVAPQELSTSASTGTGVIHRATHGRVAPSARPTREITGKKNNLKTPVLLAAGVAVACILALALSGRSDPEEAAKGSGEVAASRTMKAAEPARERETPSRSREGSSSKESVSSKNEAAAGVATGAGSTQAVAAKTETVEDFREGFAARRWAAIKTALSQSGSEWAAGTQVREFAAGYSSSSAGKEAAAWLAEMVSGSEASDKIIASYSRDFVSPNPAAGWRYLWNEKGPLGQAANYAPLSWNEKRTAYGVSATQYPLPKPAGYLCTAQSIAHPGNGVRSGIPFDRYSISAFSLPPGLEGKMALRVQVRRKSGSQSDIELCVLVNDAFRGSLKGPGPDLTGPLGMLRSGDTVYVALGPNQDCGSDSTELDWTLYKVD